MPMVICDTPTGFLTTIGRICESHEEHTEDVVGVTGITYEKIAIPFHDAFDRHMDRSPDRQWVMLELFYYEFVHERPRDNLPIYNQSLDAQSLAISHRPINLDAWSRYLYKRKDSKLPDWIRFESVDDAKAFLLEAQALYDRTARAIFNGL